MTRLLAGLMLLLVPAAVAQTPPLPNLEPPSVPLTGPMRVELLGLGETRVHLMNLPEGSDQEPLRRQTRMQFQLTGERLPDVVRIGQVMITNAEDDAGSQLVDQSKITDEALNETRPVEISQAVIRQGGLTMNAAMDAAKRSATKLTALEGSIAVAYAGEVIEVTIPNPLDQSGKILEHPALKELGLVVSVLAADEFFDVPRREQLVGLQISGNEKLFKEAKFYDEWMDEIQSRGRPTQTKAGEPAMLYQMQRTFLKPGDSMVLTLYRSLDEELVKFSIKDIELP